MPRVASSQGAGFYTRAKGVAPVAPGVFPADTIVPYYGSSNPGYSGWTVYSAADRCVMGTTTASQVGTTVTARTHASWSGLFGTTGAHSTTNTTTSSSSSTGSTWPGVTGSAGDHAHSTATTTFSGLSAKKANVILLRATAQTSTLPAGVLAFRNALTGSYGTRFNPSTTGASTVYFNGVSAGGTVTEATTSQTQSVGSTSNGGHTHVTTSNRLVISGSTISTLGTAGAHSHSVSVTLTQSIMNSTKILHAWESAVARAPAKDVVVMYVGNIANLPANWYLCDGNNGTINMNGYFAAYSTNTGITWGTIQSSNLSVGTLSQAAFSTSHSHLTSPLAGAGVVLQHGSYAWSHTHTVTTSSTTAYIEPRLFLYFIQYKGV